MDKLQNIVVWIARVLSALMIAFLLFMFVGNAATDGLGPLQNLNLVEIIEFALMFMMMAGLILAWKRALTGALMVIGGWLAFSIIEGKLILGAFLFFPIIGTLFLISCGLKTYSAKKLPKT